MKLIVGLGNPGKEYENTPHNVGFMLIETLASRFHLSSFQKKFHARFCKSSLEGNAFALMQPQTFMNLSGKSVAACAQFYKIPLIDIVVISDDLDLPPGKVRVRTEGGHGGHNGLRSIIQCVGGKQFKRIRIGVGRPSGKQAPADYLLSSWKPAQRDSCETAIERACDELTNFIEGADFCSTSFS